METIPANPKKKRRWPTFSLRGLLVLVTVVGVGLGWVIHEAKKQGIALAALEKMGCTACFATVESPTVLEYVRWLMGEHSWRNVIMVYSPPSQITDGSLVHLQALPHVSHLYLMGTQITDDGLAHLSRLTWVGHLTLNAPQVTDAGLLHLHGLSQLIELSLDGTKVTDAGLRELQQALPKCQIDR